MGGAMALELTYLDFRSEVGRYLGYKRPDSIDESPSNWTDEQLEDVNRLVQSAYRQFLYPPPIQDEKVPHEWSFLKPTAITGTTASQAYIDLQSDFGGVIWGVALDDTTVGNKQIKVITEPELREIDEGSEGSPKYAALAPQTTTGSASQSWRLLLYPNPGTTIYTIRYQYQRIPAELSVSNPYAYGGAQHSETILQSCLAVAEQRYNDEQSIHQARFVEKLAASVALDRRSAASDAGSWPLSGESTTLDLGYDDIALQVGGAMGYGWNSTGWTHEQAQQIDSVVQRGLRQFYAPQLAGLERYDWNFLKPIAELTLEAGVWIYDLPSDFDSVMGEWTYKPG